MEHNVMSQSSSPLMLNKALCAGLNEEIVPRFTVNKYLLSSCFLQMVAFGLQYETSVCHFENAATLDSIQI